MSIEKTPHQKERDILEISDAELEDLRSFARWNYKRMEESDGEADCVYAGDSIDMAIADPWVSECGRWAVDPVKHYGFEVWEEWVEKARAAMREGL